jgi:hypothetical protein
MSKSVDVAIGVDKGKVIARWHTPVTEIVFDPQNAYKVGLALSKAALDAHTNTKRDAKADVEFIDGELSQSKIIVSDQQRAYMVGAVATILKTFLEQKKTPGYMAEHCVDAVLRETAR